MLDLNPLLAATNNLTLFNEILDRELPAVKRANIATACAAYKAFDDQYDALNNIRKEIGKKLEALSRDTIPEMMGEQDPPVKTITLTLPSGLRFRFTTAQKVSCSIVDKEAGIAWLKTQGHGGLIQETVNSSSLASFAKDYPKSQGKDLPEDLFKVSLMTYTSVTKAQ